MLYLYGHLPCELLTTLGFGMVELPGVDPKWLARFAEIIAVDLPAGSHRSATVRFDLDDSAIVLLDPRSFLYPFSSIQRNLLWNKPYRYPRNTDRKLGTKLLANLRR